MQRGNVKVYGVMEVNEHKQCGETTDNADDRQLIEQYSPCGLYCIFILVGHVYFEWIYNQTQSRQQKK